MGFGSSFIQASVIDLGFALDSSMSVGAENWNLQVNGFADALDEVSIDGRYRVTFVGFSDNASTIVGPTIIDSQSALDDVKNTLRSTAYVGGYTNTSAAIDQIMNEWTAAGFNADDTQYINIATDGNPCVMFDQCNLFSGPGPMSAQAALDSAVVARAMGLDSLSVEAVTGITPIDTDFLLELVQPNPGGLYHSGEALPNPLERGFVLMVDGYDDFDIAIRQKVKKITYMEVSEPYSALLIGLGLILTIFGRRNRNIA